MLSKLAVSTKPITLTILSPIDGQPIKQCDDSFMSIDILSQDTKVARDAIADMTRKARDILALTNQDSLTDEQQDELLVDAMMVVVVDSNIEKDGKIIEHDIDYIKGILVNPEYHWFKMQITDSINRRVNFIKD